MRRGGLSAHLEPLWNRQLRAVPFRAWRRRRPGATRTVTRRASTATGPAQPNFKHGARARTRPYDECALEIEDELLALPHVPPIDAPACREIATLMALIERVDVALADGVVEKRNTPRNLIETRRGQANWADEQRGSGRSADDDLRRYEQRMRAQLANVVTVQTASLANIPSLDSLTDEEREQMERMLQLGPNVPLVQIPTNSEARAHEQAAMWGFPWTSHGFTQEVLF